MEFEFPFEVPADLTALSAEEFAAFAATARDHARQALSTDGTPAAAFVAYRDLINTVTADETRRTNEAAAAETARQELAAATAEPAAVTPPPAPAPEPAPVVPPTSTVEDPPEVEPERTAVLVASSDAPNVGGEIADFATAGQIIEQRLAQYPQGNGETMRVSDKLARQLSGTHFRMGGRSMVRHGNIAITRKFPQELQIRDNNSAMSVLEYAGRQSRLPGGSLVASMQAQLKAGKSLTAAAGWCAPSETIYELCMLETRDGILDLPEVEAVRGGFQIPEDGGPDFRSIYNSIGDEGDVILTEYEVQQGTNKVCVEIPCPDFVEVRLDVAYLCITGSLLQRRGYPEAVTRFSQGALIGLDHKVNQSVIARMVAQSGTPVTVPDNSGGDDAVSQLLSAVELAVEDIKYANRMGRGATMEVVLPAWTIAPMRAALARRRGVSEWNVSDAEILSAFTTRHAVPRFVYDWQDAYSAGGSTPGASTPITAFPTDISFLVYPAGTWVKAVRSVINLDTVYDNAMLTENQYTALFTEDGFNVLKMCRESRLYTVGFDPTGLCCA